MKNLTDIRKSALIELAKNAKALIDRSDIPKLQNVTVCLLYYPDAPFANMVLYGADKEVLKNLVGLCNSYRYRNRFGWSCRVPDSVLMDYITFADGVSCDINTRYVI